MLGELSISRRLRGFTLHGVYQDTRSGEMYFVLYDEDTGESYVIKVFKVREGIDYTVDRTDINFWKDP